MILSRLHLGARQTKRSSEIIGEVCRALGGRPAQSLMGSVLLTTRSVRWALALGLMTFDDHMRALA
jgi:hypothetical protein